MGGPSRRFSRLATLILIGPQLAHPRAGVSEDPEQEQKDDAEQRYAPRALSRAPAPMPSVPDPHTVLLCD